MSNTDCTGNELKLSNCQYTQLTEEDSTTLYAKAAVAGISCNPQAAVVQASPMTIALIVIVLLMILFLASTIRYKFLMS